MDQAIEIAKSEIERKRKDNGNDSMHTSVVGGQQHCKKYRNKPPVVWNSFKYLKMDNKQLNDVLIGYLVSICSADQIKIQRGRFVISNTDSSQGPEKHWVTFYFPKRGSYEFFDSLGNKPEDYGVGFETYLNKKYLMSFKQLQQSTSNVCGLYFAYYVMKRHQGKTMRGIVKDLHPRQKKRNDRLVVTKMMALLKQRRRV